MSEHAVIYCRSSKDRSDISIDVQRSALHDLALSRNLVIVDEFADVVESGKDTDRPGFQHLVAAMKAAGRSWNWILVYDTSRLARRRMISMIFEEDCKRRKVNLVYRNLPDSDPATEMLIRNTFQGFDEYHSIISKIKGLAGMSENVRQGWRAGGRAPRGYKLDYHSTGAIRDGAPVLKSRLVLDEETADVVRAYLVLRAEGVSRGQAIARARVPWPASSMHSVDWNALTYAGHTVWNMHNERESGKSVDGEKRRPREEWLINKGTHPALISEDQAEAIMAQMERSVQGRRNRESPLLLTGMLQTPDGRPWHSDGCGFYRVGKGKKVQAERTEAAFLERISEDLCGDEAVEVIRRAMEACAGGEPVDGRKLTGLEKRITTLTSQIGRTVDLAAQLADPTPVLRRVQDLEHQRAKLVDELAAMQLRRDQQDGAGRVDAAMVRALLRRLFAEISNADAHPDHRARQKLALNEVVERIELDPVSLAARVHYAVHAGDMLASPRGSQLSPVRWQSEEVSLNQRRRA